MSIYSHICLGQSHNCDFRSPVSQTIISSGSFGEPRSAHFHAGLDIKPRIGEGRDSIFAIEDGYISRIKISPDGYGNTVYIDHPCGYTSVYAHLHSFSPPLREYSDRVRVATKKSNIDQYPPKSSIPIKKGEFIGFMGNSGGSFGAHLHFEVRNTESEMPINPVLFGIGPVDNIPPVILGLVVYELDNRKKVMAQTYFPAQRISRTQFVLKNPKIHTSWPLIGFGLHVYDQSNGAANHNGIHRLKYKVNGEERFRFHLDSIPFHHSKYLHSHMDYGYKKQNKYVHRCYQDENNELDLYHSQNGGMVLIPNEILTDQVEITAADIFGNLSSLKFQLKGESMRLSPSAFHQSPNTPKRDTTRVVEGKFTIKIPPNTFLHNIHLDYRSDQNTLEVNGQEEYIPLFKRYQIKANISGTDLSNPIFIKEDSKGRLVNYGGNRSTDDTLTLRVNELGRFEIVEDTIAPTIKILNVNRYTNVTAEVVDNFKTMGSSTRMAYDCYVDGSWVPVDYDEKRNLMIIDRKWILSGEELTLKVSDYSGNKRSKQVKLR